MVLKSKFNLQNYKLQITNYIEYTNWKGENPKLVW